MAQKKIPYLRVVEPPEDPKEVKKKVRRLHKEKVKDILAIVILAALAVCGTYLLLKNQTYDRARSASSYTNDISDTNSYVQFAGGIVRYNRDGVVFLNRRNEEQWIQSTQIQNPIVEVKDEAFAVADRGGNSILVFTEDGLKGEIETTLPIERIRGLGEGGGCWGSCDGTGPLGVRASEMDGITDIAGWTQISGGSPCLRYDGLRRQLSGCRYPEKRTGNYLCAAHARGCSPRAVGMARTQRFL